MYDTASSHTLTVFPLSAVSVKGFLSLSRLVSLLALRLKLAQAFSIRSPVQGGFACSFWAGFLFFPDLPLPCGKVTIVLPHDSLRLAVGCHERLHIGITVLFRTSGSLASFSAISFSVRCICSVSALRSLPLKILLYRQVAVSTAAELYPASF